MIIKGSLETVAGPFTSTSATYSLAGALSTVTVTGANWTVDQFKGSFLQNLTSASNSFAVIVSNTIDTINYWSVSGFSTVGNSFQVVRPATVIQGSALEFSNVAVVSGSSPESGTEGLATIRVDASGDWGTIPMVPPSKTELDTEAFLLSSATDALILTPWEPPK